MTVATVSVSILHISDIHFGCHDDAGEQDKILSAIQVALEESHDKIDCLVFTGDLTQQANDSEFQQGQDWLVSLCDKLKIPCILVPGNHDVRRSSANIKTLRLAHSSAEAFGMSRDDIYSNHSHVKPFLEWFGQAKEQYPLFLNKWGSNPAADTVEITLSNADCVFICMNTALLSCGNDDDKKLCVDLKSLNGALKQRIADQKLVVTVGHHPPSSLASWNSIDLVKLLGQATGPHIYLHGHLHELDHGAAYASTGAGYFNGAAGAAYPDTRYKKQFSIITPHFINKTIESKVFKFHDESGKWLVDNTQSQPVPARLPAAISNSSSVNAQIESLPQATKWTNPFSDVIANGIPPAYIHRLFVEPSNSLTKLKNRLETIVEGQRGTGKTMLLRYFSFEVQSSLLQDVDASKNIIDTLNVTSTPFGIYCCLTNAGLNRSDFDSVDNVARRKALFAHIATLFIFSRFFSALTKLFQQGASLKNLDDDLKSHTTQILHLPESKESVSSIRFLTFLVRGIDLALAQAN